MNNRTLFPILCVKYTINFVYTIYQLNGKKGLSKRWGGDLLFENRPRKTYAAVKTRIMCETYFHVPLRKSDICNSRRKLPSHHYLNIYSFWICCSNLWYGGFCRTIWGSSYNCALPPEIGRLVNLTYLWVISFSTNELYCHIIKASRNGWHGKV